MQTAEDIATALRVLQHAPALPDDSAELVAIKRASRNFEKKLAKARRGEKNLGAAEGGSRRDRRDRHRIPVAHRR